MFRRIASIAILAVAALAAGCATTPAGPPKDVSVIVFPGGFNWPIWAAQEKGFFERSGVKVTTTNTPNSTFQLTNLITGKFDIAMTAIDNLVAYRESQGEAPIIGHDLIAVMGGDNGFLRLVTTPDVGRYSDLRGKTVSVDARTTGYAFVLFEMLERNGLKEPAYNIERAGGVLQRFQALMDRKHAGTLLISPFEVQARDRGFNVLGDGSATLGRYQGLVAGVRRAWAERNGDTLTGYIRGYAQGVEWLYDPSNRSEAINIFLKNVPNANMQQAETAYRVLLDPNNGFARRARIDLQGVKTVLDLRSKWSAEKKPLTDVNKYYDPRWYDAAMRRF